MKQDIHKLQNKQINKAIKMNEQVIKEAEELIESHCPQTMRKDNPFVNLSSAIYHAIKTQERAISVLDKMQEQYKNVVNLACALEKKKQLETLNHLKTLI